METTATAVDCFALRPTTPPFASGARLARRESGMDLAIQPSKLSQSHEVIGGWTSTANGKSHGRGTLEHYRCGCRSMPAVSAGPAVLSPRIRKHFSATRALRADFGRAGNQLLFSHRSRRCSRKQPAPDPTRPEGVGNSFPLRAGLAPATTERRPTTRAAELQVR